MVRKSFLRSLIGLAKWQVLLLLITGAQTSFAAAVIDSIAATPTTIKVATPSTIKVTAQITDPNVIPGSVNLQRLDKNGAVTAILGTLHDDGLNGDAVAADNTYTIDLPLNEAAAGTVRLRASAGFKRVIKRVFSEVVTITVKENAVPVANAGKSQTVSVNALVTLDGKESNDADGDKLTFRWKMDASPSNSNAALDDPAAVQPRFTPDEVGTYTFSLVVNDGVVDSVASQTTVTVVRPNTPPTANAGSNQNVPAGSTVMLDGRASQDPDGDQLTYAWQMLNKPAGSQANLDNASSATPQFQADVLGDYRFQLIVSDGRNDSESSEVTITAYPVNTPPNANAGVDQTVNLGTTVVLDGTASADPDAGDAIVSFEWKFVSVPAGSTTALINANTATPSFTTDVRGDYLIELTVTDQHAAKSSARVVVKVPLETDSDKDGVVDGKDKCPNTPAGEPVDEDGCSASQLPQLQLTANATPKSGNAPLNVAFTTQVTGGATPYSYIWDFGDGSASTQPNPTHTYSQAGTYRATVLVKDKLGSTQSSVIDINTNPVVVAPTISSISPNTGPLGSIVTINGSGFDPGNAGTNEVRFNGVAAVLVNVAANRIQAIVPTRATNGLVTVTTKGGTATSSEPFTVQTQQDFDIALAPATIQLAKGGSSNTSVKLKSTGLNSYQQMASVSVTGLPSGVSYKADRPNVYSNQDVILTFTADANAASGKYSINVIGTGAADLQTVNRSKPLSLEVLAAGATTVSGRVLHTATDEPFVGARVRLGTESTITDATGSYHFVNPKLTGDQVLLIDGNVAKTATIEYPSAIPMPVMIQPGKDNVVLTSYLQGIEVSKFTTITPGVETHVTTPEIPNYELRIPAGAVLMGWDGTPITKVNVRTVPVDKLPIKPLPEGVNARTVYLYYFYREGGANPSRPIPVTMNNDLGALPGEKVDLWYYDESPTPDANSNQWRIMGKGTVSQDGKSIVSDPGVGIPKFCCGASTASNPVPPPPPPDCPKDGNPVSLSSGAATVLNANAFGINGGRFPVIFSCGYSSVNPNIGFFGRGTYFNYDWRAIQSAQAVTVITPNGTRHILSQQGDGVYRAATGRADSFGMEATITPSGVRLKRKIGNTFEFNNNGFLVAQEDQNGNRITITRNANNYTTGVTDANGRLYKFGTAGIQIGRVIYTVVAHITDPLGRIQRYTYDAQARLTAITDALNQATKYEYNANGLIVKKTDPRGAITQYEYDAAGRAVKEILADGSIYQFIYTTAGNTITETRVIDPNGNVTTHRFNGQGVETRFIDSSGRIFKQEVDYATNRVISETDPLARVVRYTYDQNGNLNSVVDPVGNTTIIEYDQRWNKPIRAVNPLGDVVRMAYDEKGNLVSIVNAEGEESVVTYNSQGKVKSVTDALGNVVQYEYDLEGNLIKAIDPLGRAAQRRYDLANRLNEAIDSKGRSTRYVYDVLDRVTQIFDALGGETALAYDANDNLLVVTDAKGARIETNAYDLRNRLTQKTDALSKSRSYSYDPSSNLTEFVDRKGQITRYSYDALDRLTQAVYADGRTAKLFYDLAGNLVQVSDSLVGDTLYTYDALDRLVAETTDRGVISYQYDAADRLIERRINGADPIAYTYDRANRVRTIVYRGQTTTHSYDRMGRLISRTLPNGITQSFVYNAAGELLSAIYRKGDGTVIEQLQYTYDGNGNRATRNRTGYVAIPETAFAATYDTANRMLTYNGQPLTYDENGNLISRQTPQGIVSYTWDARDQLVSIQGPNGQASFKYDHLGRRIEKTINSQTTGFLYSGDQVVAELQGRLIGIAYLTGLQIDEVLARYSAQGDRTLLADALGNILNTTDENQASRAAYRYSPYGETLIEGETENSLQYTGRENDNTSLYYYRARYYDPLLKRFISEDPIGLAGGLNTYEYVFSSPINLNDPMGTIAPAAAGAYIKCVLECEAVNMLVDAADLDPCFKDDDCLLSCANPFNWFKFGKYTKMAKKGGKAGKGAGKGSSGVPKKAQDATDQIKSGGGKPLPGHKGGGTFHNDGRGGGQVLPTTDSAGKPIKYTEYDVNPYTSGVNRGPERIVIGSDGRAYYTADHYKTFTEIK